MSIPLITPITTDIPVTHDANAIEETDVELVMEIGLLIDGVKIPGAKLKLKVSKGESPAIDVKLAELAEQIARLRGFIT